VEITELSSDTLGLKSEFNSMNITQVWVTPKSEYPHLNKKAAKMLLNLCNYVRGNILG
jgi:hypothetical protein